MNTLDAKRVLETALLCAQQPLTLAEMRVLFADEVGPDSVRSMLDDIAHDCEHKGYELAHVASGWRFQSRPQMRVFLDRLNPEKPPKYSRAVMETMAIIAYRQPVTRGDIEDIRGVAVNSQVLKQIEDRGWIEAIGYREAPGRPALFATTRQFLDDLSIESLEQLPASVTPGGDKTSARSNEPNDPQGSLLDPQVPLQLESDPMPGGDMNALRSETRKTPETQAPPELCQPVEPAPQAVATPIGAATAAAASEPTPDPMTFDIHHPDPRPTPGNLAMERPE